MKVHTQTHGSVTVLVPHGPLVNDELDDLRRAVDLAVHPDGGGGPRAARRLVIDLSNVPYLDSAGIELLLELCGAHVSPHARLRLAAPSETCLEALELTDTLPRLDVYDTVENALRSCQQ